MFKTKEGRVGIGTKSIHLEDKSALVKGCRVPVVLRQERVFYKLVGSCYIAGIMQGEAVRSGKSNFVSVQIIQVVPRSPYLVRHLSISLYIRPWSRLLSARY